MRFSFGLVGFCAALLSACGPGAGETLPQKIKRAEAMMPSDPVLSEKYERSCRICHINPDSGAPLTGDATAWEPRLAQSKDVVSAHLRDGFNAMPPRGQCFDCTDDELERLTDFMARRASKAEAAR
ncbi:MAG: c-type cytochrome [Alphaproteobacteria bacterium]|jgi:cytochrome c5|nr:c-type cytochrome [Alphaproteobacteria bacterium]